MAEGAVPGGSPVTDETTTPAVPAAVAALPDVPGAVSTRPDVVQARSEVVAARERLAAEVDQLERSARATFDIKAQVRSIPDRVRDDPARAAAAGGIAAGIAAGATALVRRARRPKRHGALPEEVEDAIAKLGKNGDKIRRSLEDSFASYLKARGFEQRSRRSRLASAVGALAVPVATQVGRQAIKRMMAPPPDTAGRAVADAESAQRQGKSASKGARSGT